jgi:uncharacterized protein
MEGATPPAIVLDTSVFTNPSVAAPFGANAEEALSNFIGLARPLTNLMHFYMPPSVFAELETFTDPQRLPADIEFVLHLKAPCRDDIKVPGSYLYELLEDIRGRIDRGLRVAEKAVREVQPASVEKSITRLRDRYREALRTGLLDSVEDLDVILLAHELGAAVCSADSGLMRWAERIGLRLISPQRLHGSLLTLSSTSAPR